MYEGTALELKHAPENWYWFPPQQNCFGNSTSDTSFTSSETAIIDSNSNESNAETSARQCNTLQGNSSNKDSTLANNQAKLKYRFIKVYYTTGDELIFSSDRLVDFSNFISSVGGNLGLFLGFSFLGLLLTFFERAEKFIEMHWIKWRMQSDAASDVIR